MPQEPPWLHGTNKKTVGSLRHKTLHDDPDFLNTPLNARQQQHTKITTETDGIFHQSSLRPSVSPFQKCKETMNHNKKWFLIFAPCSELESI